MVAMTNNIKLKVSNNLLNLDGTELAALIKDRQITCEEITTTLISHIKNVNSILNAVVEERFDEALKEAKEKDQNIENINFNEKPLYGVPISIKESFHVKGMKTTGGVRSEEHTSELQSRGHLVCRLLLEKKNKKDKLSLILASKDVL